MEFINLEPLIWLTVIAVFAIGLWFSLVCRSGQANGNARALEIRSPGRLTSGGAPINDIHWNASALDESGQMQDLSVRQVGLGRYRAELPLADHQNLTLRLRDQDHDKLKVLHYHRPYPAEYRLSSKLPLSLANLESIEPTSIRRYHPHPLPQARVSLLLPSRLSLPVAGNLAPPNLIVNAGSRTLTMSSTP